MKWYIGSLMRLCGLVSSSGMFRNRATAGSHEEKFWVGMHERVAGASVKAFSVRRVVVGSAWVVEWCGEKVCVEGENTMRLCDLVSSSGMLRNSATAGGHEGDVLVGMPERIGGMSLKTFGVRRPSRGTEDRRV